MEDFYSLVQSITRRIIATTLTVANSRIRRRKEFTSAKVRPRDVKAAISSLGMNNDSRKFWATAARRLRLNVYNNENGGFTYDASARASATTPEPLNDCDATEGTNSDDGPDDGSEDGARDLNAHDPLEDEQDGDYDMQEDIQNTVLVPEEPIYMTYDAGYSIDY